MHKENYKKNPPKDDIIFDLDINNSASAYEFTGMLPTPPKSEEERKNYMDVLEFSPETVDIFQQKKDKI